ncbi:alpha-ribazole phosphatase [Pontibacter silvestris]|uniref:Alpha-ribazole phosphatase n=1 Tax=Pontibacter silvestris TaxID=2305183 RepID=A0ABW4X013_9BACT|nr:alpha-ribazole phosphatase [Pontibacter silvestris]MCC9138205.1 alpha-ribazole phosphatase [Pontibacter silvestris]
MEVYLIRHTTPAIVKGTIYGRTDVPLAASFNQEKDNMLQKLPAKPDAVFSSPSSRCATLARHISTVYKTDERLYEVNFGQWEGKTWDTVDQKELDPWMQDFVNVSPPNGENMVQMQERVMRFWTEITQQPFDKVAVITHGGVIRIILAAMEDLPLISSFDIKVAFGDIYCVQTDSNGNLRLVSKIT